MFVEASWFSQTIEQWGDRGKVLLRDLLHARRTPFLVAFAGLLVIGLMILDRLR